MPPIRRVLITGGTGFIGQVLVRQLQARIEVDEIILLSRHGAQGAAKLPSQGKICPMSRDLLQLSATSCFPEPVDVVIHLAGLKMDPAWPRPDVAYQQLNHDATLALAQTAARAGVRQFLFVSSTGVHGTAGAGPQDESSLCHPENIYERTKLAAEESLERFAATTPMAITVLRPSNVFGPHHPGRHLLTLMRTIQRGWLILPRRDGWTNYVAVDDVADAAVRLGLQSLPAGPHFRRFIANCPRRAREFAAEIATALEVPPRFLLLPNFLMAGLGVTADAASVLLRRRLPITRRKVRELARGNYFAAGQLQVELGDWPRRGLRPALLDTIRSYRAEGLL